MFKRVRLGDAYEEEDFFVGLYSRACVGAKSRPWKPQFSNKVCTVETPLL